MPGPTPDDGPQLSRTLGVYAVFATAAGTMIGAGIFILPSLAAETAGPGAALSFLIAGGIALITALAVSELATAMPKAGGGYFFVSRAMGPLLGTIVGLGAWVALVFKGSFALVGLGEYAIALLQHFEVYAQANVIVLALVAGALLIIMNLVGAKVSGILQNVIVILLLALMGVFAIWGAFSMDVDTLRPLLPYGWSGVFAGTGLVFITYLGIEKAAAISEEVKDPGKAIPRGIIGAVLVVTGLYVVTMLIVTGVIPMGDLVGDKAPVASAAGVFMGGVGLVVMAVAGLLATASTGNAAVLSSSRYPFSMARDNLMTRRLSHVSERFGTPLRAIAVTGVVMLALILIFDVEDLAKLGSAFNILVFALVNGAVIVLRRSAPTWYEPEFRMPFYPVLPLVGMLSALALLPMMDALPQIMAAVFILIGIGWYYWYRGQGEDQPMPRYGLRDQLMRIREVQALERKREFLSSYAQPLEEDAVVIELVQGQPNRKLLTLAIALANRFESPVDAVVVTEVPEQTPLVFAKAAWDREWLEKTKARFEQAGTHVRFHHVIAHDRDDAILGLVDEKTAAVLVDWHEPLHVHRLRDSHVDEVLNRAPTRVGILKHRGGETYDEITVATGGGPYEQTEIEFATALAEHVGARVTFLRVLDPDSTEERISTAKDYLDGLVNLVDVEAEGKIVYDGNVVAGLVDGAEGTDLLIMGASERRFLERTVFGRTPDRVARMADFSVLITKKPPSEVSIKKRLQQRVFGEG